MRTYRLLTSFVFSASALELAFILTAAFALKGALPAASPALLAYAALALFFVQIGAGAASYARERRVIASHFASAALCMCCFVIALVFERLQLL